MSPKKISRPARRVAALLLGVAGLSGCHTSPPARYYVLSVAPGRPVAEGLNSKAPVQGEVSSPVPIRLEQVRLPGELDRSQLVRRIDANRLRVEPGSRWAAPLDGMIRRVLSANLASRLPAGTVADPYQPLPVARPLAIDIQELYGDSQCDVSLSASWVISGQTPGRRAAEGMTGGTEVVHATAAPGSSCPEALAATMSQAFGTLADRMAAAIGGAAAAEGR